MSTALTHYQPYLSLSEIQYETNGVFEVLRGCQDAFTTLLGSIERVVGVVFARRYQSQELQSPSITRLEPNIVGVDSTSTSISTQVTESEIRSSLGAAYLPYFSQALDQHCANRIAMLLECEQGWDGADAKPLSLSSLYACAQFTAWHDLRGKEVGVFMSEEGNMILNWPKTGGEGIVEIGFLEDGYSLYVTGWDDEIIFETNDRCFKQALKDFL